MNYKCWLRLILLFIVLGSLNDLSAQFQLRKLREEILESRKPTAPQKPSARSRRQPKPLSAPAPLSPIRSPYDQQNARIVNMENADVLMFDQMLRPDMQVARGNVRFRHDNATMTCDSAHFFQSINSFDAFGRVVINQGDTIHAYGDVLYYDGNTKLARLRGNVRLENRKTTLFTDSLNYDRNTELAYYFTGGKVVDPENTLTSVWGQYSTKSDDALFSNKVKLVNENFVMNSDTLKYNTKTHIADMVGETHILYDDETDIYTNNGWYNTDTERSMLLNRSKIINKEGKSIIGDTIFYDKKVKYGESFGRVILNDTVQKSTLYGNYVYYNEENDLGIATDSALLVDWSDVEKTMYVHADTLKTYKEILSPDTSYNHAKAWYNVRFYREDIQGMADSLYFNGIDSVLTLYHDPLMWQEKQQMAADKISVFTVNKKVDKVHLESNAIVVEMVDSMHFNQVAGKELIAYVDSGSLSRVEVDGNAETIYYAREEGDSTLLGANRTESSKVVMYFKDEAIDRIILTTASSGVFIPQHLVTEEKTRLERFYWVDNMRPTSKEDVFVRFPRGERTGITFRNKKPIVESTEPDATESTGDKLTNELSGESGEAQSPGESIQQNPVTH
ncbi:MAG: OstA-like protein [Paludibacter sp.]|jgi:lipopolysaccharide export system protein LptA|nr:OstA-like protein [Paludibacter sp.]